MPGTDQSQSDVSVPFVGSDRVLGRVKLENHERENAFSEAEVRLLETVASAMGVALENARLFDETQRLLKETEQRAAEMAVINSIQQGIAGELDFQAIVDLVGDKLREVLKSDDIGIAWHEPQAGMLHSLYVVRARSALERFRRIARGRVARSRRMAETREPRVYNTVAEQLAEGVGARPGTDQCAVVGDGSHHRQ